MSIEGKQVHWYRNSSEKDANNERGTGTLVKILVIERTLSIEALLTLEDGSFVTKDINLVKLADLSDGLQVDSDLAIEEATAASEKDRMLKQAKEENHTKLAKETLKDLGSTIAAKVSPTTQKEIRSNPLGVSKTALESKN